MTITLSPKQLLNLAGCVAAAVLLLLFSTAWLGNVFDPPSPTRTPLPPATPTPHFSGEVPKDVHQAVLAGLELFDVEIAYGQDQQGAWLQVYPLVSSGEFQTRTVTLEEGVAVADVMIAYDHTAANTVVAVPVAIGVQMPGGEYIYLSQEHIAAQYEKDGAANPYLAERSAALADATVRLPRGRLFVLTIFDFVSRVRVEWSQCPDKAYLKPPMSLCRAGAAMDGRYESITHMFIARVEEKLPPDWFLVGWVFQEFDPVQDSAPNIPLP